jgi:hypothetical protein
LFRNAENEENSHGNCKFLLLLSHSHKVTMMEEKKEDSPYHIDLAYDVVRIAKKEYKIIKDPHIRKNREAMLKILEDYEEKQNEAIAKNSDVMAIRSMESLTEKVLKFYLPDLPYDEMMDDTTIGFGALNQLQKDLRSIFLVLGGTNGLKALKESVLQMQSTPATSPN